MDFKKWLDELSSLLNELKNLPLPYPLGMNEIREVKREGYLPPTTVNGGQLPSAFTDFYRICDGISINDVWNGYWLFGFDDILRRYELGEVNKVEGVGDVLVFGGNGGGGRFALCLGVNNQILYLPSGGAVRSSLWSTNVDYYAPQVLAEEFTVFLTLLLNDVKAFVRQTPDWKYINSI